MLKPLAEEKKEEEAPAEDISDLSAPKIELTKEEIEKYWDNINKGEMILINSRCPKCHKNTVYYKPQIKNICCSNCNWVNKFAAETTPDEFLKEAWMLIDREGLRK